MTDCTGHSRSIVFLHTPSCVQIFIARGSLVMIRLPLGDLSESLLMVPTFRRSYSPCNLTNESGGMQQHTMGSELFLVSRSVTQRKETSMIHTPTWNITEVRSQLEVAKNLPSGEN